MPIYTKESLENLKSRIDLIEVISRHVPLKRAGAAYKACCPFHEERSPSFVVQRSSQHYHCFGCGAHGDAISFLMQHVRMSFGDAVQYLAEQFHVPLEIADSKEEKQAGINRLRLKELNELAARFYHLVLLESKEGKVGLEYLFSRGIDLSFIKRFQIGWALRTEGPFLQYMKKKGATEKELEFLALIAKRGGQVREFFSERLMFPIQDPQGSIIGFSARKIEERVFGGKYINTKETILFKKSKVLYGLHFSRKRIAKSGEVIVVEGQLDALRLIHQGFDMAVASLGTAFTDLHVKELIRMGAKRVYLLFDGDKAGQKAATKCGTFFYKEGVEVVVVPLKEGDDPDLMLMREGPPALVRSMARGRDFVSFLYSHYGKEVNFAVPAEKNRALKEICELIALAEDPILVLESIRKLSALSSIPVEVLENLVKSPHHELELYKEQGKKGHSFDPDKILESDLLRWLLLYSHENEELLEVSLQNIVVEDFKNGIAKKIYHLIQKEKGQMNLLQLLSEIDDEEVDLFIEEIMRKKIKKERAKEDLLETIQKLKMRNWMEKCEKIQKEIQSGALSDEVIVERVKLFDQLKRNPPQVCASY